MIGLTKRHREALARLRSECDYENHHKGGTGNYVHPGALGVGIGEKTMTDLANMGLVDIGSNKWGGGKAYRITDTGRAVI